MVRRARLAVPLTQAGLGEKIGVSQETIRKIEAGGGLGAGMLEKLIEALDGHLRLEGGQLVAAAPTEPAPTNPAVAAAEALPPELQGLAARWLRCLGTGQLPQRSLSILLQEVEMWEIGLGLASGSDPEDAERIRQIFSPDKAGKKQ